MAPFPTGTARGRARREGACLAVPPWAPLSGGVPRRQGVEHG
jgi:hypothetical protein